MRPNGLGMKTSTSWTAYFANIVKEWRECVTWLDIFTEEASRLQILMIDP